MIFKDFYIGDIEGAKQFNDEHYYKSTIISTSNDIEDLEKFLRERVVQMPLYRNIKGRQIPDTALMPLLKIILDGLLKNRKIMVFDRIMYEVPALVAAKLISEVMESVSLAMAYQLMKKLIPETVDLQEKRIVAYQVQNQYDLYDFRNKIELPEWFDNYRLDGKKTVRPRKIVEITMP